MRGFFDPVQPDGVLAAIVGHNGPCPRIDLIRKLWSYIDAMGLKTSRGTITADDKLLPLFDGNRHVSIFAVSSWLNKHTTEPLPPG